MYDFPNDGWTEENLVQCINDCISVINKNSTMISHTAFVGMNQQQLNTLHLYFETLRGGVLTPGTYWVSADNEQQKALVDYNVYIHRAEEFYRHKNKPSQPRLVCTFNDIKRKDLKDSDYNLFTFERYFGEVYINYCEVGKPLFDVYKDGDDVVTDNNIRPLRYYSADFTAYFYDRDLNIIKKFEDGMSKWWDQNESKLSKLGFIKNDPKNAMGNIPVAKLDTKDSREYIIAKLQEFNTMDRVELI
jgi:hypothetical protein